MGQSLFPLRSTAAASASESGKDSSHPKSKIYHDSAEAMPPPVNSVAPAKLPDPPKKAQSLAPPQRPLTATMPSLSKEKRLFLSRSSFPPATLSEKAKMPSGPPPVSKMKRDWWRPQEGVTGAVGEQPEPPVQSRASPSLRMQPLDPSPSECTPPQQPPPTVKFLPQSGDSNKGMIESVTPDSKLHESSPLPEKTQDTEQPRFQFGKNVDAESFLACVQSQNAAPKAAAAEACSFKSTASSDEKPLKTISPTKSVSQIPASLAPVATGVVSSTSQDEQSPSKTSVKQMPVSLAKPATAPTPPPNEQRSNQLFSSSTGPKAYAAQTPSLSVAQETGNMVSRAKHLWQTKELRKGQREMAAVYRWKVPRGGETQKDTKTSDNIKPQPLKCPDLKIQGDRLVFSGGTPPPDLLPPVHFTFPANTPKPGAKPPSHTTKGFVATAIPRFNFTEPGQPKFSSFSQASLQKPRKLEQSPKRSSHLPNMEFRSRGTGQSSANPITSPTATSESKGAPAAEQALTPQKAQISPVTSRQAKNQCLKPPSVTAAQHKQKNEDKRRKQACPVCTTTPSNLAASSPKSKQTSTFPTKPVTTSKPKKKLGSKIPLEIIKSERNAVVVNKMEKKERNIPDLPASPLSPECPQRPGGGNPSFTTEQGCSQKVRSRHKTATEPPGDDSRRQNEKQNKECEPPWVTTATLAASVALILKKDGE